MRNLHKMTVENQQQKDSNYSVNKKQNQVGKRPLKKKIHLSHRFNDPSRNVSFSSSSVGTSYVKINSISEYDLINKINETSALSIAHFKDKYLPRGAPKQQLFQEMEMVLQRKENQIQALRIYRDQLKFISFNNPYTAPVRLSVKSLKGKASIQSQIINQKRQLQKQIKQFDIEIDALLQYKKFISSSITDHLQIGEVIDIQKQQALMITNTNLAIQQLYKQFEEQKRKNNREIKQIQDQIYGLRVDIKMKEDKLRDLKAKICTLYIKLHNRNSSRTKSHERNLSMSVRKFNNQSHMAMKQVFVGNSLFKNYSKQIIEKISEHEELTWIRFYTNKDNFSFQCIYKEGGEGIVHSYKAQNNLLQDNQATTDKISQAAQTHQEIQMKYLFSMKFFFKSKIVGVECRIKTDKGNKHIQIGNCASNLEHQLLTLLNKKLLTLGSYWHGKQMIGVSVWYSDRLVLANHEKKLNKVNSSKNLQLSKVKGAFNQYYV